MIACFCFPLLAIATERARLPDLWGAPFALTGADGRLVRVSEEAARVGVQIGQTAGGARALCQELVTLPYDLAAYEDAAHALWNALAIESSTVQPVSPELVYMTLPGAGAFDLVRLLAERLSMALRITVQAGIGTSKIVAASAATLDGGRPVLVPAGKEAIFLADLPLVALPDLDSRLRERLNRLGVNTLGDLRALSPADARRACGKAAHALQRLARGRDDDPVLPLWPPRSLDCSFTYEDPVWHEQPVLEALRRGARSVAVSLNASREYCREAELTIEFEDETRLQMGERLAEPAVSEAQIHAVMLRLLRRMQPQLDRPIAGLRLRVSGLDIPGAVQLELIDINGTRLPHERKRRIDSTLAHLRGRYGPGAVVSARLLLRSRRIHLWTYGLARTLREPVQVATDRKGIPARFLRRGRRYEVLRVQNRWRETGWQWNSLTEESVFRVDTDPAGLYELHRSGGSWWIGGVGD